MRLCRLTVNALDTPPEPHLAPSAIGFGIVFGEADPPFAERAKVERVLFAGRGENRMRKFRHSFVNRHSCFVIPIGSSARHGGGGFERVSSARGTNRF